MTWSRVLMLAALVLALAGGCGGLDNGVGLTPPMGFNTWNHFGCAIQTLLRASARVTTLFAQLQRDRGRHLGCGARAGVAGSEEHRRVYALRFDTTALAALVLTSPRRVYYGRARRLLASA